MHAAARFPQEEVPVGSAESERLTGSAAGLWVSCQWTRKQEALAVC